MTKTWSAHRHPGASVPFAARADATLALDALALIADQDLAHRLLYPLAGLMTAHTVRIPLVPADVLLLDLCFVMVMADIARVRAVILQMASLACRVFALGAMCQGEGMFDQARRSPARGRVAGRAISAELTEMRLRIRVTPDAVTRSTFVIAVRVAARARHRFVFER